MREDLPVVAAEMASPRDRAVGYADRPWQMLIGGELRPARATLPAVHPGDASVIGQVPAGDASDVDAAVAAAPAWSRTPVAERAGTLSALADVVAAHGEELAWIDTLDNGSPIAVMRNAYLMAVEQLRYVAGLALQLRGQTLPVAAPDAFDFTTRDPFGVVGRLIPFDHPLMFAASFGGVKNSGLGREESLEEIESCTQPKNVYIRF